MAGYRRFVAYVYEYQKGRKGRNCGFIRVEAWEERCRMEMHLLCPGLLPNVRCDIFGFVRNAGLMDGSLIGSCTTEESRADSVIETDRNNLGGSGLSLDQMGGMILTTESGAFFGTEWDDQPVRPENFRRITRAPEEDEVQRERRSVRARGGQAEQEGRTGEENRDRGGRDSGETPEMSAVPEMGRSTGGEAPEKGMMPEMGRGTREEGWERSGRDSGEMPEERMSSEEGRRESGDRREQKLPEMRMTPESGRQTGEEGREVRDREGMWEEEGVPGEGYREPERRSRGREETPGEGYREPENWREEMAPEMRGGTREEGWERNDRDSGEMPEERMSSEEGRRESGDRREQKLPEMRMTPESGRQTGEEGREVRDREGMWEEEGVPGEGYREPERRNRVREETPGEGYREPENWREEMAPEVRRRTREEGWERSGRDSGEMPEERMPSEEGRRESGDRREQKLPEMRMTPESGRQTEEGRGREVRDREGMWEEEGVPGEGPGNPEGRSRVREEMPGEGIGEPENWREEMWPERGSRDREETEEEAEKRREEEIWEEAESRRLAGLKERASEAEREERPAWGQVREEPELQGAGRGNEEGDHGNAGAEDEAVTAAEAAQMEEIPFGEEFDPFEDGEIMSCRKIQPGDFRYFQPRDRALGNNRFLQYGFYSFGHLMIGRMKNGSYILGVPGGYDQQERFMANMFGFPYFKQCGQIRLSRGRGGYWYRLINPPKLH